MIRDVERSKLDEMLTDLRANTDHRQRDVEILTPDQMKPGIVDLNAAKIRAKSDRFHKEIDAEHAQWERTRDQLTAVMRGSDESPYGLISATLNALLDVLLDDEGTDLEENKKKVVNVLNVFGT